MSGIISAWVKALSGAGLFCAAAAALCPPGRVRRVLGLACGCVMLAALLSPAAQLDIDAYAREAAKYGQAAREAAGLAQEAAGALEREVIERECAAYITDRADALGLGAAEAVVTARWSADGFWYPWECSVAAENSAALSDAIEGELGIPPERQSWGVEA